MGIIGSSGGGGGGGGNTTWDDTLLDGYFPLWTPKSTADTMDDEFNDETNMSGETNGLDAQWTAVSGTEGAVSLISSASTELYDFDTRPGSMLTQVGTSGESIELRQDVTVADGAGVAALLSPAAGAFENDGAGFTFNDRIFGIAVNSSDTTYNDGTYLWLSIQYIAGGWRLAAFDGTTTRSDRAFSDVGPGDLSRIAFRIHRSGTTYYPMYSLNGCTWTTVGTYALGSAMTNVWMFDDAIGTTQHPLAVNAWHWFRQTNGTLTGWS